MIAQLSDLSQAAQPTTFHNLLRALDDRGRLLRVYTQNIDAIEEKSGLSFGVPEFDGKRSKARKTKVVDDMAASVYEQPVASTSRLPSPPVETPRCIPLHGTLQSMHCQVCNHSFPLLEYLPALSSGQPPQCPECTSLERTRQLIGKRPRGIGRLRPSVVLYNEAHKDGEGVGNVVQKDLIGSSKGKGRSGADLLLVVGTSLRVPGTKRMVREFAKAVRSRGSSAKEDQPSGLATPTSSPRRSPAVEDDPLPKSIYLNLDFPAPTREWEGVFDTWIQGDAQQFAEILREEIDNEIKAKELASEKRRRREEEAMSFSTTPNGAPPITPPRPSSVKRKSSQSPQTTPKGKKRKSAMPPTPPETPRMVFQPQKVTIKIGPGLRPVLSVSPSRWNPSPSVSPPCSSTPSPLDSPTPPSRRVPGGRLEQRQLQVPVSYERTHR